MRIEPMAHNPDYVPLAGDPRLKALLAEAEVTSCIRLIDEPACRDLPIRLVAPREGL